MFNTQWIFLTGCLHFGAASNINNMVTILPPLLLLTSCLQSFLFCLTSGCSDTHSYFLFDDVTLSSHSVFIATFLKDGRGGGRGGDGGICGVDRRRHSIEGDKADEDDHQRDQVESRELRQDRTMKNWRHLIISWHSHLCVCVCAHSRCTGRGRLHRRGWRGQRWAGTGWWKWRCSSSSLWACSCTERTYTARRRRTAALRGDTRSLISVLHGSLKVRLIDQLCDKCVI